MATKIRLSRGGSKKRPFYHIIIADSRSPRDGKFIERLGTYDPMLPKEEGKRVVLNKERAHHWIEQGAQPTERVQKILAEFGLMEAPIFKSKEETPPAA